MKQKLKDLKHLISMGSFGFKLSLLGSLGAALSIFAISAVAGKISETSLLQVQQGIFNASPFIQYALLTVLMLPLILIFQTLNLYGGQRAEKDLTRRIFHKIVHRKDFTNDHSGSTMNLLTVDVGSLNNFYFQGSNNNILLPLIMGIAATIWCFAIDWMFGFIAIGCGILSLIISNRYSAPIQEGYIRIKSLNEAATLRLSEAIQNEEFARINAIVDNVVDLYSKTLHDVQEQAIETETLNLKVRFFGDAITFLTTILFLVVGIILSQKGVLPFSKIVLLLPLQASISNMFSNLTLSINYLSDVLSASSRVVSFLELNEEVITSTTDHKSESEHVIVLDSLSHSYNKESQILNNITMTLKHGESLALVGASGSGKSTLIKLLAGLFEPSVGSLQINGINASLDSLHTLRSQVAYVQQESPLFNRSIRENIEMGRGGDNVSYNELVEAAKMASIHDFIMTLPEGYDTIVGEGAGALSGGQRQRIAIARAFISKAPLLIMDEPTASLDHASQTAIQEVIERLSKERTLVVSAHNLSTIVGVSKIVVLEKGEIVEMGNHHQLLENKSYYYALWNHHEERN